MQARVKQGAPNRVCNAFNGIEYVSYEWRDVPTWAEGEASKGHQYLEFDTGPDPDALPSAEPVLAVDLDEMSKDDLKAMAKEAGIVGFGRMKKSTLITHLRDD